MKTRFPLRFASVLILVVILFPLLPRPSLAGSGFPWMISQGRGLALLLQKGKKVGQEERENDFTVPLPGQEDNADAAIGIMPRDAIPSAQRPVTKSPLSLNSIQSEIFQLSRSNSPQDRGYVGLIARYYDDFDLDGSECPLPTNLVATEVYTHSIALYKYCAGVTTQAKKGDAAKLSRSLKLPCPDSSKALQIGTLLLPA